MAVTYLDSGITTAEAKSPAVTIDSTDADLVVVFAAGEGICTFTSVTDDQSNSYTAGTLVSNTGGKLQCYYVNNPTNSSALKITLTVGSGSNTFWITAVALNGLAASPSYNENAASTSSLAFTATGAEDAIIACGFDTSATGISGHGSGQVEIETSTSGGDEVSMTLEINSGTAANTQSFTGAEKISGIIANASSPSRRIHLIT